jgi:hypothetical protein
LSFLDERDEPRTGPGRPTGGGGVDRQTLRVRQATAAGVGLLVLLLLVFGVKGCLSSRKEQAFKNYVNDATSLEQESKQESDSLFKTLQSGETPVTLENNVNAAKVQAEQLVDRARRVDHPDQLSGAHGALVQALGFRRDGLAGISRALPRALAKEGRSQAMETIAAQMQNFLTSDVIYTQRFVPGLLKSLDHEGLKDDVPVPVDLTSPKGFLPDIDWLKPTTVADRIARGSAASGTAATPGLHGTGLGTVTVKPGGQALQPGSAVAIKSSPDLAFDVQIENQGENEEQDIKVKISITGAGKAIELEDQLDTIAAGESKTLTVPLAQTPPVSKPVTIKVEIALVPGEKKTDNNKGSFPAVFTH